MRLRRGGLFRSNMRKVLVSLSRTLRLPRRLCVTGGCRISFSRGKAVREVCTFVCKGGRTKRGGACLVSCSTSDDGSVAI